MEKAQVDYFKNERVFAVKEEQRRCQQRGTSVKGFFFF